MQARARLEQEEFLEHWSVKHFLKNYGSNKPIWINGPTLEKLKTCQDQKRRNAYNKYIHLFLVKHRSQPVQNKYGPLPISLGWLVSAD